MIKASEYCAKIFDGTHDTPKPTQDGEYLVTSKCLLDGKIDFSSAYKISKEDYNEVNRRSQVSQYDILFSMIGTIGNTYLEESSDINYAIKNIGVFSCRNREKAIFLYYYLQSPYAKKYIERGLYGAVQKFLSLEKMRNFPVPEFSESAYKAISELRRIDDKISTNNKIIETSEKLMREIYDYWFVQSDFPDENGRPYKSSGGEMVYNETLKREIPKEWRVQDLLKNDLCKDIKPGIDKFDGAKTYYATADVINGEMNVGAQIDYYNRESRANMQPKQNSVWFAKMKNSVKHITVMPTSDDLLESSIFSTGFFGLECESETLPYIRSFIYSDYFEKVKDLNSNGATMEAISNDGVRNIKLLIPDGIILKKYSESVGACLSQNDTLRKENAKLISLRDWLLPMLMNGQVKVKDK